mmetsp:Transcript_22338/g.56846  ORF Transcript_22338/g.56846 Transcript_22338/m.56846 type:complete len:92 (-) Transcript_22338:691-966(-)|eukprot:CAMPEP_0202858538 /NCGR_PEP_ID=MMETSP1391-20130828/1026_1 /ASSEMBLY_ACC=CAM_ASM_000867 /TAXON_ID=1034604 /ORGANISM="Chlamydomonas leiostraca, Strain SAG 11-49" /LENGTH=91 /DNA_ID=CAMNT_0049537463 /DNA_START=208 /DNA_END=483 /DNA_ORIENTATION=+
MAQPVTEEVLRNSLTAHGVQLAPGADVGAAAASFLADWTSREASNAARVVPDAQEAADRARVLRAAAEALRSNPPKGVRGGRGACGSASSD